MKINALILLNQRPILNLGILKDITLICMKISQRDMHILYSLRNLILYFFNFTGEFLRQTYIYHAQANLVMFKHCHLDPTLRNDRVNKNVNLLRYTSIHQQHQGIPILHAFNQYLVRKIFKYEHSLVKLRIFLFNQYSSYLKKLKAR